MSGAGEVRRYLLREPRFRSFFVAHTISQFGDRISELAFPLLAVLVLDATAAQVSVLTGDGLRSRVAGAYAAVNYGVRPLGALTGGALSSWLGLRPTRWVAAVGGTMWVLWLLPSPIPGLRSLDQVDGADRPAPDLTGAAG